MSCGVTFGCSELLLRLLAIGVSNGAIIALNAIAVTLVYGAVRMINFAHGDLFALTSVLVTSVVSGLGLRREMPLPVLAGGLLLAMVAAIGFAMALNVIVERLAFRPFRGSSRLAPLIAGIGLSFILYQIALIWRKFQPSWIPGEHRSVPGIPEVPRDGIPDLLPNVNLAQAAGVRANISYTLKDVLVLVVALAFAGGVAWMLQRTRIGRALRAAAQDAEMAQLCGVNRDGAIRAAFAIGGALAGVAAFVFAIYYTHPFTLYGAQSGLTAFAAAVLGGIGAPVGALFGGLALGIIGSFSDYFLAAQWTPVIVLGILILLLLLRPEGLGAAGANDGPATELVAGYAAGRDDRRARWLTTGLIALALAYPALDSILGLRQNVIVTAMLVFALLALGLNLLLGFAGLLDLGYAAAFAVGGYTAALMIERGGIHDSILVLGASALAAALFGAVNGALTLRLRADELAIATLAFGQIVPRTFLNLDRITGGSRGIAALPAPQILGFTFQTPVARYYLALAALLLVAFGSVRLLHSRVGRAWRALSEDEDAAASSGVNPLRSRMTAFSLGAALAGVAGALFAVIFSYVSPDQSDFRLSAMVLAMVVIGGAGSVRGAIFGAFIITALDQLFIPGLGALIEPYQKGTILALLDVRALSFLSFGVALYLTVLLRARRRRPRTSAVFPRWRSVEAPPQPGEAG